MNDLVKTDPPVPASRLESHVAESKFAQQVSIPYKEYLCDRQQLAIRMLLCGERERKVAETIGVCRQTIWRWRQDLHFRGALAACRDEAYGAAFDRLRGLVPEAVDRVEDQLEAGNAMAPFRVLRLAREHRRGPDEPPDPK